MKVNFTMLTSRRPRLLRQALDTLGTCDGMNITILADNATDETVDVLEKSGLTYYVSRDTQGTGLARNRVIELSKMMYGRGDLLYLSDDDVRFHKDWLTTLTTAYDAAWERGFRVLGAYNHPFHQPIAKVSLWGGWQVKEVLSLALQSMLMRWDVWEAFGPFNQTEPGKVCDGEDVMFGNRIRESGGRLGVISPALVVNCGITNSFGQPIPGADLVRMEAPLGVVIE